MALEKEILFAIAKAISKKTLNKKITNSEAREMAREELRKRAIRNRPLIKQSGLSASEKTQLQKRLPVTGLEGRRRKPEDVVRGRVIAREEMRKKLANPPAAKPVKKQPSQVFLTRGPRIASRQDVEEILKKVQQKQAEREKFNAAVKKLSPEEKQALYKKAQTKALIKKAVKDEQAGKSKYGMDVKTPREQLDERVLERAKELTAKEKIELSRKRSFEIEQGNIADRRVAEALKEIARREKLNRRGRGN